MTWVDFPLRSSSLWARFSRSCAHGLQPYIWGCSTTGSRPAKNGLGKQRWSQMLGSMWPTNLHICIYIYILHTHMDMKEVSDEISRTQFIPGISAWQTTIIISDDLTGRFPMIFVGGCRRKKILKTSRRNTCSSWAKQKNELEEHSEKIKLLDVSLKMLTFGRNLFETFVAANFKITLCEWVFVDVAQRPKKCPHGNVYSLS